MATPRLAPAGFRHEALLYDGETAFLDPTVSFLEDGVAADEAMLVVISARKIELLKALLGPDAGAIDFADMNEVGLNPARIIPAWRAFVEENSNRGRPMRGIGEPIWAARGAAELAECHLHEALLNVAFADTERFWLLCPYDTQTLGSDVMEWMARNHPFLNSADGSSSSEAYDSEIAGSQPFLEPLPEPPARAIRLSFSSDSLKQLRRWIGERAGAAGLSRNRSQDFVIAVNEIASNSVRYGGGSGNARVWEEAGALICDVSDGGHITEPLAGRQQPRHGQDGGRGLWLANQLCDLVQIRSSPAGTLVRLHQWKPLPAGL